MEEKRVVSKKRFWRRDWGKFLILFFVVLFIGGCASAPSKEEMTVKREQQAKDDLAMLRPSMAINFEEPLTLEQVVDIGLRNNLEIRIKKLDQEIASKETLAQKLRMLPGLNAEGTWMKRDLLRKSDVYDWQRDQDLPDTTVSELKERGTANLSLTWNVLDTILAYVRSGQSEMRELVLEKQRRRQGQQLALDIIRSYWQAAAVEDALDHVKVTENRLKTVNEEIERAVAAGDVDKMDAADSKLRLKELELTIRQLQANLSTSRLDLAQLMGFNQNVQFTLARPPIHPIIARLPHPSELDIDALEEYALKNRPELYEKDLQYMIHKEHVKSAILKLFPGLNFFASTHYDDNRLLLSNTWNTVGANIGWNLLDIPAGIAALQGHEKAVDMAEAQRLMMTVGVITQVHIALLDYAIKVDRFKLLEETYLLAADLLNMARKKFEGGMLPQLAVTQRYLEEMAAKLRRDEAVVDLLVAHKRLCVSIGIDPMQCDQELLATGAGRLLPAVDTSMAKKWKCSECGYEHVGPQPPEKCPVCGAGRDKFKAVEFSEGDLMWQPEDKTKYGKSTARDIFPMDDSLLKKTTPGRADSWTDGATHQFLWKVQVGAFVEPGGPQKRIAQIKDLDLRLLDNRDTDVSTKRVHGRLFNRVRVLGLTQEQAKNLAGDLNRHGMEYWILPPHSLHW